MSAQRGINLALSCGAADAHSRHGTAAPAQLTLPERRGFVCSVPLVAIRKQLLGRRLGTSPFGPDRRFSHCKKSFGYRRISARFDFVHEIDAYDPEQTSMQG
jgi:hypothetical protein